MTQDATNFTYADLMGCAPLPADLDSLFSSPATDVADPAVVAHNNSFMDPSTDPLPTSTALLPPGIPLQPRQHQPQNATMDSLLHHPCIYESILPTPISREAQIIPINMPPQPPAPPHLQSAIATELALPAALFSSPPPPPPLSTSPSSPPQPLSSAAAVPSSEHRTRPLKRKRSLETLRAAAAHSAPDVNVTDEELISIGDMHESEADIQRSKEVYFALQQLKQALAGCNFRIKSLHLEQSTVPDVPFDFIVSKSQPPRGSEDTTSAPTPSKKRLPTASSADANPRPSKRSRCILEPRVPGPSRLTCLVCQKSVADLDTLVRHFRHAHQDLKPYSCTRCGGLYATENTLWAHLSNVHPANPRKFKCDHCDASFDQTGARTRHEHSAHNKTKLPYVCSFEGCSLGFKFPAHLETHAQRAHPNFRPFVCSSRSCSKRFPNLNGLNRHEREVHEKRRVYRCHCGKSIPKRDHLKRHLLNVHKMSPERVKEEMKKYPHPGVLSLVSSGPGPPTAVGRSSLNAHPNAAPPTHQEQI